MFGGHVLVQQGQGGSLLQVLAVAAHVLKATRGRLLTSIGAGSGNLLGAPLRPVSKSTVGQVGKRLAADLDRSGMRSPLP